MLRQLLRNVFERFRAAAGTMRQDRSRTGRIAHAAALIDGEDPARASRLLASIVAARPDDAQALHHFARIALKQDRVDEAIAIASRRA